MIEAWAAPWVKGKLLDDPAVESIEVVSEGVLAIERKSHPSFFAAILGQRGVITRDHIDAFLGVPQTIEFYANVPRDAVWSGEAISIAQSRSAAFGGFGDLGRAVTREARVGLYRNKELAFFEDGLAQHSAVKSVIRLFDRKFQLERRRGSPFTVVLVDAYDMSAEHVRDAQKIYGAFDAALKMSSYGKVTSQAKDAAASMGAEAFKWGELLSRLNRP